MKKAAIRGKNKKTILALKSESAHLHAELEIAFKIVETAKIEWEKTMDCVQDMVMLVDKAGGLRRCNRPTAQFFGAPFADIIGKNWLELLKSGGISIVNATDRVMEVIQAETDKTFEIRLAPVLGESGWSSTSVTIRDITEHKELARKIKLDEDRFEALWNLNRMQDSTVGELVDFALDSAVRLTGSEGGYFHLMNEKPRNRSIYVRSGEVAIPDLDGEAWGYPLPETDILTECIRMGKPVIRNDCLSESGPQELPEGRFSMRRHMSIPVFDGETIVAVAGVSNKQGPYQEDDVSQLFLFMNDLWRLLIRKKQAEDLRVKNIALKRAFDDLKAVKMQAFQQEKLASIGQIAAGVAHEINNPVGYIMSNLGALGKYAEKLLEFMRLQGEVLAALSPNDPGMEQRRRSLKIDQIIKDLPDLISESLEGAERIRKIVQDLKGFSRADDAERAPADINAGIESTINIVWNELKYKASVRRNLGNLPTTVCNIGQMNQVFMNLLVNAAHSIEKSGEILITTWEEDGFINILVSDTGCGIPAENLDRIFDPFYTTKPVGKGTGLGLSIAYDIVKKHDGEITVKSEVGSGSCFTVRLPVLSPAQWTAAEIS